MVFVKLRCVFCGREFSREKGRYNEAKKFGWRQFCSLGCQYKARVTRVKMKCGNPDCKQRVSRLLNQFKSSKSRLVFCSRSCAAVFNNTLRRTIKVCPICNKEFYRNTKYCSRGCYAEHLRRKPRFVKVSKKQIIKEVQNFYQENDRIPVKREYGHYNAARDRFGSWNNAISAAGFNPNPILFADKQVANDGHRCDSLAEKIIDDWLSKRKIQHDREVFYPNSKKLKVDFVVNGHWIEFFGLSGELKDYDRVIQRKLAIVKKHKIPFLALYPKDIFPISRLDKIINVIQNPN